MTHSDWIGRAREARDLITPRLEAEFRATFDRTLDEVQGGVPGAPGLHWCLSPEIWPPHDLGRDGHPKTGLFLPDLGLPRRMWAGGKLRFRGALAVGEEVVRRSRIADISFKEGRSGRLGFVTVELDYAVAGETRIEEIQTIVYRDDPGAGAKQPAPPPAPQWEPVRRVEIETTPTLLFRYSAITFNGHRIHYDPAYATRVEGYGGLVVHGPMQSTWMQHMATSLLGRLPADFSYRGLSPLICGRPAAVEARRDGDALSLRVRDLEGDFVTMEATAR
ncbi:MAG: MaoC family dehydratase N-terminal domain-containing protein [Pikeienuella sp.]